MPLHTDFRPESFDDFFGNEESLKLLKAMLKNPDRPHSYLFVGPKGCGKTTLARVFAKELGCNLQHDFIELNAASFRGIDTARDIIKKLDFKPMSGDVRVWFLDEAHSLTKEAQEALLKAVEQPPEHTYFIFSTTDPQDLKPTLKDRCMTIKLQPLTNRTCVKLVNSVLRKLNRQLPQQIKLDLCDASDGRPRTTLVLLEKLLAADNEEEMRKILETNNDDVEKTVIDLCQALMKKRSWKQVATILKSLEKEDPEAIRRIVLGYFRSILLKGDNRRAFEIMLNFSEPYYNTGKAGLVMSCYACFVD